MKLRVEIFIREPWQQERDKIADQILSIEVLKKERAVVQHRKKMLRKQVVTKFHRQ